MYLTRFGNYDFNCPTCNCPIEVTEDEFPEDRSDNFLEKKACPHCGVLIAIKKETVVTFTGLSIGENK